MQYISITIQTIDTVKPRKSMLRDVRVGGRVRIICFLVLVCAAYI